jgi:hypothetical protein
MTTMYDGEGRPTMEEEMSINNKMIFERWSGEKEGRRSGRGRSLLL